MKILKYRIYGTWESDKMIFTFYPSGECTLIWKETIINGKVRNRSKAKGSYEIINNKLVLKYGDFEKNTWIAEILYLYEDKLITLDLNGEDIGKKEYHKKISNIESNEEKWFHKYIAIPNEKLQEIIIDITSKLVIILIFAIIIILIIKHKTN